jgi:hypothetical protein
VLLILPIVSFNALVCVGVCIGDPSTPELKKQTGILGPIVSKRQHDSVLGHINNAIAEGAQVLTGGRRPTEQKTGNQPHLPQKAPTFLCSNNRGIINRFLCGANCVAYNI